ncbi:MAG: chromosome segregation protein SMC [Methylococcales symbiont of Iophon sp. n. MRB-2018]|nr:MAG: chromosome segregation protein SMC [Methylococcales symbiont of Iophon sp. n. MRB-2018]KAF3979614.1 MAG: chromosome segregation protein SMC [Methylococcales symbiont of Iophon sp. n. MRB-2018]
MKLDKIKLSGFKSFADQTTIHIKGNLTAIVGPNGCGKSNVIDAVRWVMGESSAKHLRGGQMADVIFNGSSTRKPVSIATVELIFDNSEGKVGGEYAKYNSISIKRQVNRDGLSQYFLNGTKCRRKDITDLFLGTGLGARSYAIIEQGTISRMVESKPDELRVHIEEAAGISKYKERRYETETRMRHTRENLERLDDLTEEVEKQRANLKKQSEKAQKFTVLKKQERQYKRDLLAIRWNSHHQNSEKLESKLKDIATEHNRLFVLLRETDKLIDAKRIEQKQQQQQLDSVQENYYHAVAEVSRLQQMIQHNESSHEETVAEINRLKQQTEHSNNECEQDKLQLEKITETLLEAEEQREVVEEQLEENLLTKGTVLENKAVWQIQWEDYLKQSSESKEQAEVQRVKLSHLNNQSQQLQQRLEKLQTERSELSNTDLKDEIESLDSSIELIETDRKDLQQQLGLIYQQIIEQRQQLKQQQNQLHQQRSELHPINGKITSLELLQQHAMGKDKKDLLQWLDSMGLSKNQRLAELLQVEDGWEKAVETVLNSYLDAICVDNTAELIQGLQLLKEQSITLFQAGEQQATQASSHKNLLLNKINAPYQLSGLLTGIYCADNIKIAKTQSLELKAYESIVTPEGDCLGRDWIKISRSTDSKTGVLQRVKELRDLKQRKIELQDEIEGLEAHVIETEQSLKEAENSRENLQQRDKTLGSEYSAKSAQFSAYSAKREQQQQRLNQMGHEVEEIMTEIVGIAKTVDGSEQLKGQAEQSLVQLVDTKQSLDQQGMELQSRQYTIDLSINETQKNSHTTQGQIESLKATAALTSKQIERLHLQNQQSVKHIAELETKLHSTLTPLDGEKLQLDKFKDKKEQLENSLQQERSQQQKTEQETTELSEKHVQFQRQMEQQKDRLDKVRFEQQESNVRQQTITEQLKEIEADPEQVLETLSPEAEEQEWKIRIETVAKQIERLGSINLTAIEEYKTQSERVGFLNEQREDLMQALNTLDQAISKIDKESRIRFKETFDKINQGLQTKFPKLFGGGQAYLELTEQDLLEAEVNIIARPPGKRNSSIHLLSGGEKALTAVALVFSIFDLNPAPFCLLDEVDAPLDDANVVRFSQMVEEMSETVQFLYVSHNKVTIEIARQLSGVTMKEPGVSRMVSVDIDEAVEMANN